MNKKQVSDTWERGSPYEQYVGRWSRQLAPAAAGGSIALITRAWAVRGSVAA
jgi:hypothetical protein